MWIKIRRKNTQYGNKVIHENEVAYRPTYIIIHSFINTHKATVIKYTQDRTAENIFMQQKIYLYNINMIFICNLHKRL